MGYLARFSRLSTSRRGWASFFDRHWADLLIDQPAKAGEDSLNMKAYAEALTAFIADARSPLTNVLTQP